jgi:site-specific DNA-adenine methylase
MTYSIAIYLRLFFDPWSGEAVLCGRDKYKEPVEKSYTPEEFKIPQQYRKYLRVQSDIMESYTEIFRSERNYVVSASSFLYYYPPWDTVKKTDISWTEEDHKNLYAFLKWCSSRCDGFYVKIYTMSKDVSPLADNYRV